MSSLSVSAASHRLLRLARKGQIRALTRGLWVKHLHPHFTPMSCVPFLLRSDPGYVSFLSALHRHGLVSQIPARIQIATTGHHRTLRTEVGVFEYFQVHPRMSRGGVEWSSGMSPYRLATPEKALLDTLYLSTRKNRRFSSLPELDLSPSNFRHSVFQRILREQVPFPKIQTAIRTRLLGLGIRLR